MNLKDIVKVVEFDLTLMEGVEQGKLTILVSETEGERNSTYLLTTDCGELVARPYTSIKELKEDLQEEITWDWNNFEKVFGWNLEEQDWY